MSFSYEIRRWCLWAALSAAATLGCSADEQQGPGGSPTKPPAHDAPDDQATVPLVGAEPLPAQARDQIEQLLAEKRGWSARQQKIDSQLLLEAKRRAGAPLFARLPSLRSSLKVKAGGRVEVDIDADVDAELILRIQALGGVVESSQPDLHAVRTEMPLNKLEELADEESVKAIHPALGYVLNKVDTSEGDVAHRANVARTGFGLSGAGVKVGVISNGVNTLAARVATGDLPSGITVLSGQAGSGDEGTAMLEIVYDLAPSAQLMFATANGGEATFASNIRALRDLGAKVIVDDVYYYGESTFQDDVVAQAVEDVASTGVLYFSAAGNGGNLDHANSGVWEGDFLLSASTLSSVDGIESTFRGGSATTPIHDFVSGQNWNSISVDPSGLITLEWSDPRLASANDYDLFLLDSSLTTVEDASISTQAGTGTPFEAIDSTSFNDVGGRLVIAKYSGADRFVRLDLNVPGRLSIGTAGQIGGHAAAASAVAVAAVNVATAGGGSFTGGTANPVETFSADGPRRVFFAADNTPITAGNFSSTGGALRQKPDLAAADGVSTSTPGFKPFFGTSAAAPHAAAIAALLVERYPTYTAAQIRTQMVATALDIEGTGFDRDAGNGIVMADRASAGCSFLPDGTACDDGDACTTGDVCGGGACHAGAAATCDDGNGCTDDSCNPASGCVHTNNTASCSDGSACTVGDTCGGGTCHAGAAATCDDSNGCTDDTCNPASGCVHTNNTASCSDGSACTVGDTCGGGTCVAGSAPNCDDSNGCTDDSCNPASGCVHANNTASCSDGNACTVGDVCGGGSCQSGGAASCDDSNTCTDDSCNPASGCVHTNNTASCSDGSACTVGDACSGGTCVAGSAPNCDDSNGCTDDTCNPASGCVHANNTASCSDGNACTVGDVCGGGTCHAGAAASCDDSNGCTDDTCDPSTGCAHSNNTAPCSDGDLCTSADVCHDGACLGQPKTCEAVDGCHLAGECNSVDGTCTKPLASDGTVCSGGECVAGLCTAGTGGSSGAGGTGGTGGAGTGGTLTTGGTSGAGGTGGTPSAGGTTGGTLSTGGTDGLAGESGAESGGAGASGASGEAGASGDGGGIAAGGTGGGSGGSAGHAVTGGSGGNASSAGRGDGGAATQGGTTGVGGVDVGGGPAEGAGGRSSSGGQSGSPTAQGGLAGATGQAGAGAPSYVPPKAHHSGCGCSVPSERDGAPASLAAAILAALAIIGRRRSRGISGTTA